jgi:uncharacterized protein YbjT (DUF2867 family)
MDGRVLVTGGSGYVGGRLIDALERLGADLRVMVRRPDVLRGRVRPATEVVAGDVLVPATLDAALARVDTAYYLVHSMGTPGDFAALDRQAAVNFGAAARRAGVRRIVYLGGLGDSGGDLSPHLQSRHDTGAALRESGVPVVELRASIVIGSGSLSFEMVRALVERLPVMVCPRWVAIQAQPIAIDDAVAYLVEAAAVPVEGHRIFEIGGPDVVSYGEIMREYARQRGLRRLMIPVPLLTPHLSSLWLGLVTPLYARVGRKLIGSLRNATVVRDASALSVFRVVPRSLHDAIARAIAVADGPEQANRWSDARSAGAVVPAVPAPSRPPLIDHRETVVTATPAAAFAPIRRIGGDSGWYCGNGLWKLRGALDILAGGVGMRRGRRHPDECVPGDAVDFWRVERCDPDRRLVLEAEMKVPGRAWLEFQVEPIDEFRTIIRQTARFEPSGFWGRLYWYALLPVHAVIFSGMLRGIARRARVHDAAPAVPREAYAGDRLR